MAQQSIGNAGGYLIGSGHQIDPGQPQQIANFRGNMIYVGRQCQIQSLDIRAMGQLGLQAVA